MLDHAEIVARIHDGPVQLLTAAQLRLEHAIDRDRLDRTVGTQVAADVAAAARELRALMAELQAD